MKSHLQRWNLPGSLDCIPTMFRSYHEARGRNGSLAVRLNNCLIDGHGETEIISSEYDSVQTGLSLWK
jgi:hypothetical protein